MRSKGAVFALLLLAGLLGAAQEVAAQPKPDARIKLAVKVTYRLEGDALIAAPSEGAEVKVGLGCAGQALREHKGTLYVACGADGVRVYSLQEPLAPKLLGVRSTEGAEAAGLFVQDDRVWARLTRTEAVPVSQAGGGALLSDQERSVAVEVELVAAPPVDAPPVDAPAPPEVKVVGAVVEVEAGRVVVDLGAQHGVLKGDRIELYVEEGEELGAGQQAVREDRLAVAEVIAVSADRAKLRLGLNESVPLGTLARPSELALTGSLVRPPRVSGLYETSFMARPFFALGDFGVGMVSDASFGYRGEHLHLMALMEPVGVGLAKDGNVVALAGNIVAAYDTQMFEVGLGLGWSAVNDSIEDGDFLASSDNAGGGVQPPEFDRVRSGLSIAQVVRLGALDGFHLSVHNTFLVYESQFNYGGTTAALQIPVAERAWLLARGGGGVAGYAYGELGLRVLVRGNGGSGSIFITPSVGGAGLFGEKDSTCTYYTYDPETGSGSPYEVDCAEEVSYGGPMVGFGMEFRH